MDIFVFAMGDGWQETSIIPLEEAQQMSRTDWEQLLCLDPDSRYFWLVDRTKPHFQPTGPGADRAPRPAEAAEETYTKLGLHVLKDMVASFPAP